MSIASIQKNPQALYAAHNLRNALTETKRSAIRMSSGIRLTAAFEDPSGTAISLGLGSDLKTLRSGLRNAAQASMILGIADGALSNLGDILSRQKVLITQSNNYLMSDTERGYINDELHRLEEEFARIVAQTKFNEDAILDGTFAGISNGALADKKYQVGFSSNESIALQLPSIRAADIDGSISTGGQRTMRLTKTGGDPGALEELNVVISLDTLQLPAGLQTGTYVDPNNVSYSITMDPAAANMVQSFDPSGKPSEPLSNNLDAHTRYISVEMLQDGTPIVGVYEFAVEEVSECIDNAIRDIKTLRAMVGSLQSRFEFAKSNIETSLQNTSAVRSEYLDTDIAHESSVFANSQVKIQSSIAVLSNVNLLSQHLLEMLKFS